MKRFILICSMALASLPVVAQTNAPIQDAQGGGLELESVDEWLKDNIDPDALRVLGKLDDKKLALILSQLQQAINGTNIYELGALRDSARECIPLLKKYDETARYGDWLQSQLNYLEAAATLERWVRAISPRSPNRPLPAPSLTIQKQYWRQTLERSAWPAAARERIPELKRIFSAEHVPADLVWVAEVESSFDPGARSPSGAAGMFQLMPATARKEQLSLWPRDERLQPEKNARAAARYLHQLHERYGDWELALAAFNAGPARVDKLLKRDRVRSFEEIAGGMPAETQMYVPKVEATVWRREGHDLKKISNLSAP